MPQVQPEPPSVPASRGTPDPATPHDAVSDAPHLDEASVLALLASAEPHAIDQLAAWLQANPKEFAPLVMRAAETEAGLSAPAASVVLDALNWRTPTEADTTLALMESCLRVIAGHISQSVRSGDPGTLSDGDDALVGSAVVILTASRRFRHSETAIVCLADSGPGGALILARAFDAVRGTLKLNIVRRLKPQDVLELGDNVVASLADSVSRLADELEPPKRKVATRFLAELGPVNGLEPAEISPDDPLEVGDSVFHASWGAGTVVAVNDESATIDFGSAGKRSLLRAFATLRRVE